MPQYPNAVNAAKTPGNLPALMSLDSGGRLKVTTQGDGFQGNQFVHISANGNNLNVAPGPAVLVGVNVNTAGATGNILTLYNSLTGSGAVVGVVDTTVLGQHLFNVACPIGLSAVTATGAAADVTLIYRPAA